MVIPCFSCKVLGCGLHRSVVEADDARSVVSPSAPSTGPRGATGQGEPSPGVSVCRPMCRGTVRSPQAPRPTRPQVCTTPHRGSPQAAHRQAAHGQPTAADRRPPTAAHTPAGMQPPPAADIPHPFSTPHMAMAQAASPSPRRCLAAATGRAAGVGLVRDEGQRSQVLTTQQGWTKVFLQTGQGPTGSAALLDRR